MALPKANAGRAATRRGVESDQVKQLIVSENSRHQIPVQIGGNVDCWVHIGEAAAAVLARLTIIPAHRARKPGAAAGQRQHSPHTQFETTGV